MQGDDSEFTTQKITRKQLHSLVWSRPVSEVAKDFELSPQRVKKLCQENDVPIPPPGYWASKRSGKPVRSRALPKRDSAAADLVAMTSAPAQELRTQPSKPSLDLDIEEALENARALECDTITTELGKPHRLLKRQSIDVRPEHRDRARRLFDALIRATESLGFRWRASDKDYGGNSTVEVLGERFTFRIRERMRTRRFDPSRDEHRGFFAPNTIMEPRGLLVIERRCNHRSDAARSTEEEYGDLDSRLQRIILATIKRVQAIRNEREVARRWRDRVERDKQERRQRQAERELEKARIAALLKMAADHDHAEQLRRFLTSCRASCTTIGDNTRARLEEWLGWGECVAAEIDPLSNGLETAWDTAWNLESQRS